MNSSMCMWQVNVIKVLDKAEEEEEKEETLRPPLLLLLGGLAGTIIVLVCGGLWRVM